MIIMLYHKHETWRDFFIVLYLQVFLFVSTAEKIIYSQPKLLAFSDCQLFLTLNPCLCNFSMFASKAGKVSLEVLTKL